MKSSWMIIAAVAAVIILGIAFMFAGSGDDVAPPHAIVGDN